MREDHHLIEQQGKTLNIKSGKEQNAYVLTERGRDLVRG
jgi:predicted transcriptional regulator